MNRFIRTTLRQTLAAALFLAATCSSHVLAQKSSGTTIDLSDSSPDTSGDHWTYNDHVYTILDDANVTVTGSDASVNYRRILIDAGAEATVTLDNATINSPGSRYNDGTIFLKNNAKLMLILADGTNNRVTGATHWPAIAVRANENAELTIRGTGSLTANGGNNGAGIGGSSGQGAGKITILGGTVTANGGGEWGASGIGGGFNANVGSVTISGGTVTANRGGSYAPGIGCDDVTITGGSVKGYIHVQPKNGTGTEVFLNILQVGDDPSVGDGISVTAGSINGVMCDATTPPATGAYGIRDVKTRDGGKVYFYLPKTTGDEWVKLEADDREYGRNYTREANHNNDQTLLLPYGITLDITGTHNFPDAIYGYGTQSAPTVTVTNTGYNSTGALDVELGGTNLSDFTLSKTSISDIAFDGTTGFTVTPNTGLAAGTTYTATVTVSKHSDSSIKASFTVSFTVNRKTITVSGGAVTPKPYDGNQTATVTGLTFPGLVMPEAFTLDEDYTLTATYSDASADSDKPVKAVIELKAAGPVSKNYTLNNGTNYSLTGHINPKAINITGGTATKPYDGTTAAKVSGLTFDVSLANSELNIGTDYTVANATYAGAGVGTGITVTADVTLNSPSKADNYILLNGAGYRLTTGVITPKTPPVTALDFILGNFTYDGSARPVTVTAGPGITGLGTILAVKYTGTDYPASTTAPAAADTYTVTVDIAAGTNYAAIAGLVIGTFTIAPATPTVAVLDFTLRDGIYDDRLHPVTVTPAAGIEGLGTITVLYSGSTTPPVYPGEYTVTIDIAAGTNYTAFTGLPLGTFNICESPTPVIRRLVTLLPAPGLTTDPSAGPYYINSGTNFTFRLTPDVPSPNGAPPQVHTTRTPATDGSSGIRMTPSADGSYTVVILAIRQNIEITLSTATDNAPVADAALEVLTAPGALVIANSHPDAATVHVYNLAGMLVRLTTVPPGTTRLSVTPGIYIVTDGAAFRRKAAVVR
jgi:hypothetical protein